MTPAATGARLRIAVLTRAFAPCGGAERYAIALVERLAARHDIHVFAQQVDVYLSNVTYHRIPAPMARPRWVNQLWFALYTWWCTRRGFDVVHSHENTWHGDVQTVHVRPVRMGLFADRSGVRRWMRYLQVATGPRLWAYLALEHARMRPRPGRILIAVSEPLRDEIAATYPSFPAPTTVLPPGVTVTEAVDDRRATREALGLTDSARMLLFVAYDYRKKGLPALIEALSALPSDVILVIVGPSGDAPPFQRPAAAAGVAERVRFVGTQTDLGPMYRAADLLVHPTLQDSFAMVVLEAMAHALPVIVSDRHYCGISTEFVDEREALLLKNPRDSGEIAAAILRLLHDRALRSDIVAAGQEFVQRCGWAARAAEQERIYHDAVRAAAAAEPREASSLPLMRS